MIHAPHNTLPEYNSTHIWHDGCEECEYRGERVAIQFLDQENFAQMWRRAWVFNTSMDCDYHPARCEIKALHFIYLIQLHLELTGLPGGTLPAPTRV